LTTTIYDKVNKEVASDTRWSAVLKLSDNKDYIVYVDDCKFEKIADRNKAVLILAGDGRLIAEWKEWWCTSLDKKNLPETSIDQVTAISLLIIDKENNQILFDAGNKKAMYCDVSGSILSVFSGSGDVHAASCWYVNRCAKKSIVSASKLDYNTSNIVKSVEFISGNSNLAEIDYNYSSIVDALLDRGMIMNLQEVKETGFVGVPLNQAQMKEEVEQAFAKGSAVASAPVPGLSHFVWNEERTEKLMEAIDKVKELEEI